MDPHGDRSEREETLRMRLRRLDAERAAVSAELESLSRVAAAADRDRGFSPAEKVALFRGLFHAREDVYASRWENPSTGRAGYAPRCRSEWRAGVCGKPKVRCGECPNQAFEPLDDAAVRDHLQGRLTIGAYALLRDDACWFCAIDLDGAGWREDARAVRDAAGRLGVPVAVERSRSGDGAHVWMFFSEPVAAAGARRLASALLTEATALRPAIGLTSYDRLFPSQDALPRGGFGNLIALPLQHAPRRAGCSVFLGEDLSPHADQWAFLAGVERIAPARLDLLLAAAEQRVGGALGVDDADDASAAPWRTRRAAELPLEGSLPAAISARRAQQLYIERDGVPPRLYDRIRRLAAFANPTFHERQRLRLPTGRVPRIIACAEEHPST